MNFWDQILASLQQTVSQESYQNWFKGSSFIAMEGETLLVSVPDRETRTWLETEYAGTVRSAIQKLRLPVRHVSYESLPIKGTVNQALAAVEPELEPGPGPLNPKLTFDTFVVGACNQFA